MPKNFRFSLILPKMSSKHLSLLVHDIYAYGAVEPVVFSTSF